MPQISSVITGGAAISVAPLAEVVEWAAGSLHVNMPVTVATTIAAGIVAAGHAIYNVVLARQAAKNTVLATPQ